MNPAYGRSASRPTEGPRLAPSLDYLQHNLAITVMQKKYAELPTVPRGLEAQPPLPVARNNLGLASPMGVKPISRGQLQSPIGPATAPTIWQPCSWKKGNYPNAP